MELSGSSSGDPRELGIILAGEDGVALDSFICHILGCDPLKIPTNRIAYEKGLGETDLENIQVMGDIPVIENLRWPLNISYTLEMIPHPIARGIMKFWWTRPAIDPENAKENAKGALRVVPLRLLQEGSTYLSLTTGISLTAYAAWRCVRRRQCIMIRAFYIG
jgi:hypothetical protein